MNAPVAKSDEAQLVERSQAGDRLAFEELVHRHAERLYAVVLRFVADADEAEEVTQETFLRAWRSIDKFELRSRFFTWLYPPNRHQRGQAARGAQAAARHGQLD